VSSTPSALGADSIPLLQYIFSRPVPDFHAFWVHASLPFCQPLRARFIPPRNSSDRGHERFRNRIIPEALFTPSPFVPFCCGIWTPSLFYREDFFFRPRLGYRIVVYEASRLCLCRVLCLLQASFLDFGRVCSLCVLLGADLSLTLHRTEYICL